MSWTNGDQQGWISQNYQQPNNQYSQTYAPNQSYSTQYPSQQAPYIQPYNGTTAPTSFVAELPAPLPPAPPTTTSEEQLKEDELIAHKIQQLEIAEVRQRSNSAVSQHQQPVSMIRPSLQTQPALLHQVSSLSLRPQSTNTSTMSDAYWSPESFDAARNGPGPSLLPEVVVQPQAMLYDATSDLPIPVHAEQPPVRTPPLAPSSTSHLSTCLERDHQVHYPPTWRLPSVIATFYAFAGDKIEPGSDWLTQQETLTWRTIRPTEHAYNPAAPSYKFKFTSRGGGFRDPKFSWSMTLPDNAPDSRKKTWKSKDTSWSYDLKLDKNSGMRKNEVLSHGSKKGILTTYVHARNYDSLRFIGPDGRAYMWVSSSTVSSINGSRYDTLRHALFVATGPIHDALYGAIVADHTFWDGHVDDREIHTGIKCDGCQTHPIQGLRWTCKTCPDHNVCDTCRTRLVASRRTCTLARVSLPAESLSIRSPSVDRALVVATLQILKDWERHTLRAEKSTFPHAFAATEHAARQHDLGAMSYWKAGDWDTQDVSHAVNEKMGSVVKVRKIMAVARDTLSALGGSVDAGFALAGHGTGGAGQANGGGGHANGAGGRGGGGDGGGGGGGASV
ncbi:hypothetical protein BDU57DRAFT_588720 [Ampelomyces quisqualis]|uniref:ZZ-type domain-containing protein n=1 Tax=Ampelomyces quisqualis TaxID=50730 RepID=A0A6A5QG77_AMPQU|nr:hypothetical protein BDU57DRAFT_588720 [Ampelomyces quisqualis]